MPKFTCRVRDILARRTPRSSILTTSSQARAHPIISWRPILPQTQQCSITNATKPDHVPSLLSLPRVASKPGGWAPTLFHSSGEVKFTVIRLAPGGGEVPSHLHNKVWDYFIPLEGEAVIETRTTDGVSKDFEMKAGGFLAVGPGDMHRVKNKSETEEFVFLIAQAPRKAYDYVPEDEEGYVFKG